MGINLVELKAMLNYDLHKLTHQVQQLNIHIYYGRKMEIVDNRITMIFLDIEYILLNSVKILNAYFELKRLTVRCLSIFNVQCKIFELAHLAHDILILINMILKFYE